VNRGELTKAKRRRRTQGTPERWVKGEVSAQEKSCSGDRNQIEQSQVKEMKIGVDIMNVTVVQCGRYAADVAGVH